MKTGRAVGRRLETDDVLRVEFTTDAVESALKSRFAKPAEVRAARSRGGEGEFVMFEFVRTALEEPERGHG